MAHRIDGPGHVGNLFTEGDPSSGTPATTVTADWLNYTCQEEICNAIEAAGLTLAKGNDEQLESAIRILAGEGGTSRPLAYNGRFLYWQRQTTFSLPAASGAYTADLFRAWQGTGGAATITRQTHAAGASPDPMLGRFFLQWAQGTGASSGPWLEQRQNLLEETSGLEVTVSFYARVSSGTLQITPRVTQYFGVGGSANVDTDGSGITVDTTWTRYQQTITVPSISGKTIGTGSLWVSWTLIFPTGTTFTAQIAGFQVEPGPDATPLIALPHSVEFAMCQTRFFKTYVIEEFAGSTIQKGKLACDEASGGTLIDGLSAIFPTRMRAQPTVVWYSPTTGTANKVRQDTPTSGDRSVVSTQLAGDYLSGRPVLDADYGAGKYSAHVVAMAEL